MHMNIITIPHTLAKNDDLVILPRKQYEYVLRMVKGGQTISKNLEAELTALSREAKSLKSKGKLQVLKSLRDLRV